VHTLRQPVIALGQDAAELQHVEVVADKLHHMGASSLLHGSEVRLTEMIDVVTNTVEVNPNL